MADASYKIFTSLPTSSHGFVLAEIFARSGKNIIYVAVNDAAMEQVAIELSFFASGANILRFPAWDVMPYDRISPKPQLMAERLKTLSAMLAAQDPYLLLTTTAAMLQKLPPEEIVSSSNFTVRKNDKLSQNTLIERILRQGYHRAGKALEAGEFAVRGSIIDVIPAGSNCGYRLDWFGEEIESIKIFEPMTQISSANCESINFAPTSEVLLSENTIRNFREGYRELFGAISKDDVLYESISQGVNCQGMEHYLPLFYGNLPNLFDYSKDAVIFIDNEVIASVEERLETIRDYYDARKTAATKNIKNHFANETIMRPLPAEQMFITKEEWNNKYLPNSSRFSIYSEAKNDNSLDSGIRNILPFIQGNLENTPFDQLKQILSSAYEKNSRKIIIACASLGSRERLQAMLMERGLHAITAENWPEAARNKNKHITLVILPIDNGFQTPEYCLLSEQDIFGERIIRKISKKKQNPASFFAEAASFSQGELVVHKEHGIGRFEGLITVSVGGAEHDCLKIIYEGGDKLFLPVENINLLSRFGMEEENVKLDKLGGASWQSRKARLKNKITIAAEALIKIAAERAINKAEIIEKPLGTYDEFIARFGFIETEDQARAIEEVLADLESGKPMDRLICGDVGFGKTEVALRAAFAVALCQSSDKKQVALICPTTLLARQHYKNFKNRFAGFPIEIRQLSRMVSAKEQKQTLLDLKEGKVDIVIGTHSLLASGVEFKNLGLMIVDEEQHFGVAQKEKLKNLRSQMHVLTLSATPIPRTLQMAMTGIRDLSLITTPPIDRLAIRSFVMPFDTVTIREAIMRELHRGGQCFVVTPRIKHLAELRTQISELIPEAKICTAHGQMPAKALDEIMNDFYDGKYNLLLSTAIIESGLDIPTANTIIIHNAHLFGLSQLYQMRGRVGRGKIRAYAYFMLPHRRELTANATRRLEIMQTLDNLGAGFTLASHDMDIRGFGNLVGEEQSGHIREVGIELYQQMLEEAIKACSTNQPTTDSDNDGVSDFSPTINLGLSVLIPEYYVNDLSLRMGLYRRASNFENQAEIENFAAEIIDRFGKMPEETKNLIDTLSIKLLCKKSNVERVDLGPKGAVISFFKNKFANPEALIAFTNRRITSLKIRNDQKLILSHEWKSNSDKISVIKKLLQEIADLI